MRCGTPRTGTLPHRLLYLTYRVLICVVVRLPVLLLFIFSLAMQRLGGRVLHFNESTSSVKKGETLEGGRIA